MTDPIGRLAARLTGRWDAIVGIPRGGLIVAAGLGYALDVQDVQALGMAYTRNEAGLPHVIRITSAPTRARGARVLLVEDATATGTLLDHARRYLHRRGARVTTTAVWVSAHHDYRPDVWLEAVDVLPSGRELLQTGSHAAGQPNRMEARGGTETS